MTLDNTETFARNLLAVVREGAMPGYVSFWNERVMG